MNEKELGENIQQEKIAPAFILSEEATEPCRIFIIANGQVVSFINEFAGMAFRIENIVRTLSDSQIIVPILSEEYRKYRRESGATDDEDPSDELAAALRAVANDIPKAEQIIRPYVPLLNQMLLSRAVDNFLLYLTEMLLLMYKTRLGTLPTSGADVDEFIGLMTEQYVERTSMGGTQKLISDFKNTFNFRLFPKKGVVSSDEVDRVITRRNVIVHNRGIASRYYLRNVPTPGLNIGDPIPLTWDDVRADVLILIRAVLDIDERLSAQFGLPQVKLSFSNPPQETVNDITQLSPNPALLDEA